MSLTGLLFSLAFLSGLSLAVFRHPIFGLLTYVAAFYIHPPSRWWGQGALADIRWALIAAGLTLLMLIVRNSKSRTAPFAKNPVFIGLLVFVSWIAIQSLWAIDQEAHSDLIWIYLKFLLVIVMVCRCIESEQHLRWFLWAHALGCGYLGWIAYGSYAGGRLDGVGGPGINEANAAALQIVTGIFIAGGLFLYEKLRQKAVLFSIIPFMVNAVVSTISRGGFLAAVVGGIIFNMFTSAKLRTTVRVLSVLAVALFAMLANQSYWDRISTIKLQGERIEGVDTGGGRLEIIDAQWRMFKLNPMGCGHMCTTALSPRFIEERFLSHGEARASHNTFMTMIVDHGVVGGALYVGLLVWITLTLRAIAKRLKNRERPFIAAVFPAVAAAMTAIIVGDMFAQYPKFEARIWFISILIVILHFTDPLRETVEKLDKVDKLERAAR